MSKTIFLAAKPQFILNVGKIGRKVIFFSLGSVDRIRRDIGKSQVYAIIENFVVGHRS